MNAMFKRNFNLKLSSKGKILVAIPLCVQVFAAMWLSFLLADAEAQAARVELSRQITSQALQIATQIYDAEFAVYNYLDHVIHEFPAAELKSDAIAYDERVKVIPSNLKQLKKLASVRPKEREIVEHYSHSTHSLLKMLNKMRRDLDQGEVKDVFALGIIMAYSKDYLRAIDLNLKKLVDAEKEDKALYDQVLAERKLARELIYFFLGVNVAVVLVLLRTFNRGTVARLGVLMDNTSRLAKHQPLNPLLDGQDELADRSGKIGSRKNGGGSARPAVAGNNYTLDRGS